MKKILLILLSFLFVGCGLHKVEYTNRTQLITISEPQELQLGLKASEQIKKENKKYLNKDKAFLKKVQKIGKNLSEVANKPSYNWEFHVISKDTINAFCLPGGKIYVYTGIQKAAKNDDQLATVISHEIAHAIARHGAERASMGQIVGIGGQLFSIIVKNKAPGYEKAFSYAYGYGANFGLMLPYSRKHEYEADKIGLTLMDKAGYDTNEALKFWSNMQNNKSKSTTDFFSTHPSTKKRIEHIKNYNQSLKDS